MPVQIPDFIYHLSYLGIFLWFALLEQITPVPEEVSLISLGYISMHSNFDPFITGLVSIAGLLTADNIIFYLSLKGSKLAAKLTNKTNETFMKRMRENLKRNSIKTLVIMALLPKVRFLSPVISASSGISWKLFFYVNSIATVFYVVVYMLIGILFQKQLQYVFHELEVWQHVIFVAIMIIIAFLLIIKIRKVVNPK